MHSKCKCAFRFLASRMALMNTRMRVRARIPLDIHTHAASHACCSTLPMCIASAVLRPTFCSLSTIPPVCGRQCYMSWKYCDACHRHFLMLSIFICGVGGLTWSVPCFRHCAAQQCCGHGLLPAASHHIRSAWTATPLICTRPTVCQLG